MTYRDLLVPSVQETDTSNNVDISWGTWVAQLVKHPTLDFGSGHDLRVMRLSRVSGSVLGVEPAYDFLSPFPSAPPCPAHMHTYVPSLKK